MFNFLPRPPYHLRVGHLGGRSRKLWHSLSTQDLELGDHRRNSQPAEAECRLYPDPHGFSSPVVLRYRALLGVLDFSVDLPACCHIFYDYIFWCLWLFKLADFIILIPGNSYQSLMSMGERKYHPVPVFSMNCLLCSWVESGIVLRGRYKLTELGRSLPLPLKPLSDVCWHVSNLFLCHQMWHPDSMP